MRHNLESRLRQLEAADLDLGGQTVIVCVQYESVGEAPVPGPTYTYVLPASGLPQRGDQDAP